METKKKRPSTHWNALCSFGSGMPAYGCNLAQIQADNKKLNMLYKYGILNKGTSLYMY